MITLRDGPAAGTYLVKGAPPLLRAVIDADGKGDVLDNPTDRPEPTERIYAYARVGEAANVHINKSGFYARADYKYMPSVDGEKVRNNAAWWAWVNVVLVAINGTAEDEVYAAFLDWWCRKTAEPSGVNAVELAAEQGFRRGYETAQARLHKAEELLRDVERSSVFPSTDACECGGPAHPNAGCASSRCDCVGYQERDGYKLGREIEAFLSPEKQGLLSPVSKRTNAALRP